MSFPSGVKILGEFRPEYEQVLNHDALQFLAQLHREFDATRLQLLQARMERQKIIDNGGLFEYPTGAHDSDWQVAPVPDDLQCRHVEITGPTDCKMVINALNSGSDTFMADFEDSLSPTWKNVVEGQINLMNANKKTIQFNNPDGSIRKLKENTALLLVRTRGWHLDEQHIEIDGTPLSGSLMDFGLHFFHNIHTRLAMNSSTYFYLPKMEHHLECRLWNDVFKFAEEYLKLETGKIRATVMVETLPAALEMEAMLYELRNYACGMNAGRWDYIFSIIKRLKTKAESCTPDRHQVDMMVPFMRNYTERLVRVCHKHGAHAMGGMSAFIPSRRNAEVNRVAIEKVSADKEREVGDGFDGTWVAHPDLVKLAKDIFVKGLNGRANQVENKRSEVSVSPMDLQTIHVDGGKVTESGVRVNVSIALQYLNQWLEGHGAVAINNLMEDAATAEISRAQLWQWLCHSVTLEDGRTFTNRLFRTILAEELAKLGGREKECYGKAAEVVEDLVLSPSFPEFLTLSAYDHLATKV